jgi:hypothetical protein
VNALSGWIASLTKHLSMPSGKSNAHREEKARLLIFMEGAGLSKEDFKPPESCSTLRDKYTMVHRSRRMPLN